jgi:hypothetical protein
VRIIFPAKVWPEGYARAFVDRARTMEFASKDDALLYHSASINADSARPEPYEGAREATESFWRSSHPADGRALKLFEHAKLIRDIARGIVKDKSQPTDLFEKALWQRDLICSLQAVLHCREIEPKRQAEWNRIKEALQECLDQAVFTSTEFDELQRQMADAPPTARFTSRCSFEPTEDYLPPVVWRSGLFNPSSVFWHELPSDEAPGLHFQAYGGRSFVRIFVMTPGMSATEFFTYWAKVTKQFGMNVTVSAAVASLPAGTQTVLLRTFGLFLEDGSFADSRIPEEVLVRIFKYTQATLDAQTSDGLGTLHYQYKLRRNRLLNDPATLGLDRIQDADGQFYGFFAEVPEPDSSEHLTTMRANCISCHSELLYGASTVFTLCRRSPAKPGSSSMEGGRMEKMGAGGWLIKEEALHTIQKDLVDRLKSGARAIAKREPQ